VSLTNGTVNVKTRTIENLFRDRSACFSCFKCIRTRSFERFRVHWYEKSPEPMANAYSQTIATRSTAKNLARYHNHNLCVCMCFTVYSSGTWISVFCGNERKTPRWPPECYVIAAVCRASGNRWSRARLQRLTRGGSHFECWLIIVVCPNQYWDVQSDFVPTSHAPHIDVMIWFF
jgi:hypothetical protein